MENPFALPLPLFTRKRKAPPPVGDDRKDEIAPFICEETYHAYAIDGHARESTVFHDELARREAVRAALALEFKTPRDAGAATTNRSSQSGGGGSVVARIQPVVTALHAPVGTMAKPVRHLTAVLLERAERERSRELVQVVNIARRQSSLSIAEHVEYMRLRQKRIAAITSGMPLVLALAMEKLDAWRQLDAKVKTEQNAFVTDLERLVRKEKLAEYTHVPPRIDQLYETFVQSCRNQVMHLYPRYYEQQLVIRLHGSLPSTAEQNASSMKHVKEVQTRGPRPIMSNDELRDGSSVGLRINDEMGNSDSSSRGPAWTAISADPTAEKLMELHDCDVAMTSSTLVAIFDSVNDGQTAESAEWTIPVKSRMCMVHGRPRRQIYLDRPLVNPEVSAREKMCTVSHHLVADDLVAAGNRGEHVSYHVWRLGQFKVLVRTKTRLFTQDAKTTVTRPVSLFVKPDHKPLGIEERLTDSEFRRMWLHAWIRGGSKLVLGRLSPKSASITSWSEYQLPDFLKSLGAPGFPDAFEPLDFFFAVNTVLTSLHSLPPASFLLRYGAQPGKMDEGCELHVYRSATEIGIGEDHPHQFDLFQHINSSGQTSGEVLGYIPPTWPPVPDRAPYTYRTGSCCLEFLQRNMCETEACGNVCESVHLRLVFNKKGIKWTFEDLSTTTAANRAKGKAVVMGLKKLYPQITPKFPFCRGVTGLHPSRLLANVKAPIRCEDPAACSLPHLSLYAIAERVADEEQRAARERRRRHKSRNKAKKAFGRY